MSSIHKLSYRQMAVLLAMLMAIMPFSVDAYLPALPQIAQALNSDIHHIEKSLSSFIFGVALGQLSGGPLSDIKGRRNVALTGLAVYLLASSGLIAVQTVGQLLFLRMVQAVGAGMTAVTVGAIVRDYFQGRQAAQMFALIGIIMMAAPLAAPMIGSWLQLWGGWRVVFAFLFLYALSAAVLLYVMLPQNKSSEPLRWTHMGDIARRYARVLRNRPALGFLFYQAASFSAMLVFLAESPFVYMQLYHLSPRQYAWAFGCNIITMMAFNRITAWRLKHGREPRGLLKAGIAVQMAANACLAVWVWRMGLPPLWTVLPLIMVSVGAQGLIVANSQALFMGHYEAENGGSANAVLSAGQSLIAAAVTFTAAYLHNGTALVMAGMMLAVTSCGLLLLLACSRRQLFA